jgi:hypothetical protein
MRTNPIKLSLIVLSYLLTVTCAQVDVYFPRPPHPPIVAKPMNAYIPISEPVSLEELKIMQVPSSGTLQALACDVNGAGSVKVALKQQQTSSWCWAATARTVINYFVQKNCNKPVGETCDDIEEQCKIVNKMLAVPVGEDGCCEVRTTNPNLIIPPPYCYKGGWPDHVLDLYQYQATPISVALDWEALTREICLKNPFLYVIERRAGGKHVRIVKGYSYTDPRPTSSDPSDQDKWVEIYDPLHSDYEFIQHREYVGDQQRGTGQYGYWHVYDYVQIRPIS